MNLFSNKLIEILRSKIEVSGPITFKDFMEIALYHKEYGYYAKSVPLGKKGDFVTGPHTHPIYGALHSRQIEEFWNILGQRPFSILEMGAGAGYLAKDILSYMSNKAIFEAINYIIVEHMPVAVSFQQEILKSFIEKVKWVTRLSDLEPVIGCLISNELLDSFAVHVIQKETSEFKEIYVNFKDKEGFVEVLGPLSNIQLTEYIKRLPPDLPNGYRTEVNLALISWLKDVSRVISRGFVTTVDYGYTWKEFFHPMRNRGTLLAYKNQRVTEDLYKRIGDQDLTAHVNFSDLHRWGKDVGLHTLGYTYQWAFLGGLDFEETFLELSGGKFDPFSPELAAIKMLLIPQGMGETHKVLVQGKGIPSGLKLKGFKIKNIMERL